MKKVKKFTNLSFWAEGEESLYCRFIEILRYAQNDNKNGFCIKYNFFHTLKLSVTKIGYLDYINPEYLNETEVILRLLHKEQ